MDDGRWTTPGVWHKLPQVSQKLNRDSLVTDVQLICQQLMNDLLTIKKVGQQRSRMTRLYIITARRFLASKNQFQLAILEFGCLGHQHTNAGKIKVNQNYLGHVPNVYEAFCHV